MNTIEKTISKLNAIYDSNELDVKDLVREELHKLLVEFRAQINTVVQESIQANTPEDGINPPELDAILQQAIESTEII